MSEIKTVDAEETAAEVVRSHTFWALGEEGGILEDRQAPVKVTVEYKPREEEANAEALQERAEMLLMDYHPSLGSFVTALYTELVDAMYPGYSTREKPWEQVPMLVEADRRVHDNDTVSETAILGSFF